jgi:hypothetical protein
MKKPNYKCFWIHIIIFSFATYLYVYALIYMLMRTVDMIIFWVIYVDVRCLKKTQLERSVLVSKYITPYEGVVWYIKCKVYNGIYKI